MRQWWKLALIASSAIVALSGGCGGNRNGNDGPAGDDDDDDGCGTVLVAHWPEDGATDVYHRTVVDAMIATAEPDAQIYLSESDAAIPGTTTTDVGYVRFVPEEPLTPGATYTATLDWSCPDETWSFTVGADTGTPVETSELVNRTYSLDLRYGRFASPINIGELFQEALTVKLLLNVTGASAEGLELSAGSAVEKGDEQDLCSPTTAFEVPADFSANPYWSVEQSSLQIMVLGDLITATDLELSGQFSADGSQIEHVSIATWLDTRDMLKTITGNPDAQPGDACDVIGATYGVRCVACPTDGGEYCFRLVEDGLTMPLLWYTLEPRSPDEIAADPTCQE